MAFVSTIFSSDIAERFHLIHPSHDHVAVRLRPKSSTWKVTIRTSFSGRQVSRMQFFSLTRKEGLIPSSQRRFFVPSPSSPAILAHGLASIMDDEHYIYPRLADFLLTDVQHDDLRDLSVMFGLPFLGKTATGTFPVEGVVHGPYHRLMLPLSCQWIRKVGEISKQKVLSVMFLLDTGSPYTYLASETIEALTSSRDGIPGFIVTSIQGQPPTRCFLSPLASHFSDVNVLGSDFLDAANINLSVSYFKKNFTISQ
mmetsp:Transcript_27107/g.44221  ORF Transcript_27107/g.44221 Transcript_27107/m.44221 type:complete len:255 (+) Transcript_27107:87-851(+)